MQRGACGLLFACMIGRISGLLHGFLEVGGGGEADDAAGRDLDFLTRVRVAADAGGAFTSFVTSALARPVLAWRAVINSDLFISMTPEGTVSPDSAARPPDGQGPNTESNTERDPSSTWAQS